MVQNPLLTSLPGKSTPDPRGRLLDVTLAALVAAAGGAIVLGSLEVVEAGLPFGAWAPVLGLWAVPALVLVPFVVAWVLLVHAPTRLGWSLLLESSKRRFRLLILGAALPLVWLAFARLVLALFASELAPRMKGLALGGSSLAFLFLASFLLEEAAARASRRFERPGLVVTLGGALALFSVGLALLVHFGATSGVGGPFALLGVLRRPELVLGPARNVALLGGALYAGALFLPEIVRNKRSLALLGALPVVGLVSTALATPPAISLRIERSATIASRTLVFLERISDSDGDGVSALWGGGDCDDHDATRSPAEIDLPGNGIDEDCSGEDATLTKPQPTVAPPPQGDVKAENGSKKPAKPNVILLTIDTLRYDLGFMRADKSRNLSPRLDELASRSTVFERASSLASYTSKSLGPALIGRYASETARNWDHFDRFSPSVPWVPERLQKAGIHTLSVQGYWYFFMKGYGYERGFDVLDSSAAPRHVSVDADDSSNGDKIADRVIAALDGLPDEGKQFYLWAHWVDPHAEYVKHEKYDFGREQRDRYDGEVAFVDEQMGRILDALAKRPFGKDTIVIFTADHGEAFGEHGLMRHGFEIWEELVHVAMIVHVPGVPAKRVRERRSLIDIAPTLLDAFDVKLGEGPDEFMRGKSLLTDVLAAPGTPLEERPVFVDMVEAPNNKERRAFYSGPYKIITSSGRVIGVFNLDEDPGEKKDLSEDEALVSRLKSEQAAFVAGLKPVKPTK